MTNIFSMTKEEQAAAVAAMSPVEQAIFAAELFASLTSESREEILDLTRRMAKEEAHG